MGWTLHPLGELFANCLRDAGSPRVTTYVPLTVMLQNTAIREHSRLVLHVLPYGEKYYHFYGSLFDEMNKIHDYMLTTSAIQKKNSTFDKLPTGAPKYACLGWATKQHRFSDAHFRVSPTGRHYSHGGSNKYSEHLNLKHHVRDIFALAVLKRCS